MAAPNLGFAMAILMTILGLAYMKYAVSRALRRGRRLHDFGQRLRSLCSSQRTGAKHGPQDTPGLEVYSAALRSIHFDERV